MSTLRYEKRHKASAQRWTLFERVDRRVVRDLVGRHAELGVGPAEDVAFGGRVGAADAGVEAEADEVGDAAASFEALRD